MIISKPKFWDDKIGIYSLLLYPLTLITKIFVYIKKKFTKKNKFDIPIICVGNIYIGGTGKTPTSILLAKKLSELGKKPAILRKYYSSHKDEHDLIVSNFKNLILDKDRVKGIKKAINDNYNTIILDDGFQDYKIKKDLNIICFNKNQLIGNGLTIPSGPLREDLNSLIAAHIVLINGDKDTVFERKILNVNKNLKIFYSFYKPLNIENFRNKNLMAIAAIGNPSNFFNLLEENNLIVKKKLIYPDHYEFSKKEIENIFDEAKTNNYNIIVSEKDYFKLKDYKSEKLDYLKVSLVIKELEDFIKEIELIYA